MTSTASSTITITDVQGKRHEVDKADIYSIKPGAIVADKSTKLGEDGFRGCKIEDGHIEVIEGTTRKTITASGNEISRVQRLFFGL